MGWACPAGGAGQGGGVRGWTSLLRPKESYITCRGRDDGGGAQVMACASAMIYARLRGLTYAHSPLTQVAHAPAGVEVADWSAAWEKCFALGAGEVSAADLEARGMPVVAVPKPHRFWPRSHRLHVVAHCHKVTDRHPEEWAAVAPVLRRKYFSSPKPVLPDDPPDAIRVSIHVRRGDVASSGRFAERFTADGEILRRVARLLDGLGADRERVVLRMFSEGEPAEFAAFAAAGATLHLGEDAFTTFHHLVCSQVVVLAKSTFSYLAGLIGGGLCLYEPFWHPPLPGWLTFGAVDSLSPHELAAAVRGIPALGKK